MPAIAGRSWRTDGEIGEDPLEGRPRPAVFAVGDDAGETGEIGAGEKPEMIDPGQCPVEGNADRERDAGLAAQGGYRSRRDDFGPGILAGIGPGALERLFIEILAKPAEEGLFGQSVAFTFDDHRPAAGGVAAASFGNTGELRLALAIELRRPDRLVIGEGDNSAGVGNLGGGRSWELARDGERNEKEYGG